MQPFEPNIQPADVPQLLAGRQEELGERACLLLLGMMEDGLNASSANSRISIEQRETWVAHVATLKVQPTHYIEANYRRACAKLLGSQYHDRVMAMAAIGKVRLAHFSDANQMAYKTSFVRKRDGSLFSNAELKRLLRERSSIDALLLSVAKTNDVEAYHQIIKAKPVAERASIQMIMETASSNRIAIPPEFLQAIAPKANSESIDLNNYVGSFKGAVQSETLKSLLINLYDAAMTPLVGHELFHGLFSKPGYFDNPVNTEYVHRLVKDGADWYIGLKQAQEGSHAYLGLLARKKDPVTELGALVKFGGKKTHQALVARILESLPEDVVMAYADTQAKANQVYRIARLECIKNSVSKAIHEKNFRVDLGL